MPEEPRPPAERPTDTSTTPGLPVAPDLGADLQNVRAPKQLDGLGVRTLAICGLSVMLAVVAAGVAKFLAGLIAFVTNIAFYGRLSFEAASPAQAHLGWWTVVAPVIGGLLVGLMARYGSAAIRGHGIPEAMEKVLFAESRIPARITFLKPVSSAIAIGTGGPFGAEGPIIATGGALGSLIGQVLRVTADERKTLLAAGAAAGMAATFGAPVSAVLLAVELLLFEFRPRSAIPVALATTTAAAVRWSFEGSGPMFPLGELVAPGFGAVGLYVLVGALMGLASVGVTRAVYWIEDQFERLPLHWMWWPALGAVVVGIAGLIAPRTLGVGYDNISDILNARLLGGGLGLFVGMKFLSWAIALGSGTSGGTLAPLFSVGGGLGALLGVLLQSLLPAAGVDPRVAALVGMAAIFAGASRALLTSVVFAFEVTLQPLGLLPLLGGCSAAYLVSALLMRHSIMTAKIARRGARVPLEYSADFLDRVLVGQVATGQVITLKASQTVGEVRSWFASHAPEASHHGYPVVDEQGAVLGILTQRDVLPPSVDAELKLKDVVKGPPAVVFPDNSVREAADHMLQEGSGRLVVVSRDAPRIPIGIITRSDVLGAHVERLAAGKHQPPARGS